MATVMNVPSVKKSMLKCSHLTSMETLRVEECVRTAKITLKASTVTSASQATSGLMERISMTQMYVSLVTATSFTRLVTVLKVQGSVSVGQPSFLQIARSAMRVTMTTQNVSHVTASSEALWEVCVRWVVGSVLVRRITLVLIVTSVL